jgi:hypothetical protein
MYTLCMLCIPIMCVIDVFLSMDVMHCKGGTKGTETKEGERDQSLQLTQSTEDEGGPKIKGLQMYHAPFLLF